jgi:hypothetical protein
LLSLPRFVILLGCAPIHIPGKTGGYNSLVRPPFFVANSEELR